ncbi:MAG: hypothetical protein MUD01_13320 [Chloroflexaceae bacterium]|jgi:photosystem II stability/assembly factor-like uncharacterized protein|nr:hypothetical protein [Chloroflexaceae bacterium]
MAKAGIVYVGTDDGLIIFSDPGGIGRWRRVGQTLEGQAVTAIVAVDALTLTIAAGGQGRFSGDGGQSWEDASAAPEPLGLRAATTGGPLELANPRLMGATAYARLAGNTPVLLGAGAGGAMFFRSEDDGIHWEPAAGTPNSPVTVIVPASYHMDTAWAGTETGQLLCSDDRGRTWEHVADGLPAVRALAVVRLA